MEHKIRQKRIEKSTFQFSSQIHANSLTLNFLRRCSQDSSSGFRCNSRRAAARLLGGLSFAYHARNFYAALHFAVRLV